MTITFCSRTHLKWNLFGLRDQQELT